MPGSHRLAAKPTPSNFKTPAARLSSSARAKPFWSILIAHVLRVMLKGGDVGKVCGSADIATNGEPTEFGKNRTLRFSDLS